MKYDEDIKIMCDLYASHQFEVQQRKKTRDEGIAEAMEKGMEKGIGKGMEKGMEKGINLEKVETLKRLLSLGLSADQAAIGTKLPVEEVMRIMEKNETIPLLGIPPNRGITLYNQ